MRISNNAMLILCLLSAPAVSWAQASGVPVDPAIAVVSPPSDIPRELAIFSGKWAGSFNGANTGAYMSDAFLAVEEISSPTAIRVYYGHIGRHSINYGDKLSLRATAKFANGTLDFTTPDAIVIACTARGTEALSCTYTNAQGAQNRGNLRRIGK